MSDQALSFVVTRTRQDYFDALFANGLRRWPLLVALPLALFVVALAPALVSDQPLRPDDLVIPLAITGGWLALYVVAYLIAIRIAAQRSWAQPGAGEPLTFRLSREAMAVDHVTGSSSTAWNVWKTWFETKAAIIIRHQIGIVQIIPKRDLTPELLGRVRALLGEVLPAGKRT